MSRFEALFVHLATVLVGGTGLIYAWMRYFAEPQDPWSPIRHPWQPTLQHLHVLLAPLLVFALGFLWRQHVWPGLSLGMRERRRSGLALTAVAVPMAASGYLLQTATDETWRKVWIAIHLATSLLWLLAYAAHQLQPRLARRAEKGEAVKA